MHLHFGQHKILSVVRKVAIKSALNIETTSFHRLFNLQKRAISNCTTNNSAVKSENIFINK